MKKISAIIAVVLAVVLTGCDRVSKEQYQQVTNSNDSLLTVALQQGNEIYELSNTLRAVSDQLDQINGKISLSNGEDRGLVQQRENLMEQLALVQRTIIEKQQALEELQSKFGEQLNQNKVLQQTLERFKNEVAGYQQEIESYKNTVVLHERRIADLSQNLTETQQVLEETQEHSEMQQQVIDTQDQMLNAAYYIVGSKSELKDRGLLEGGAFSRKRLTTQGFSEEGFTKIDIRQFSQLTIPSKKADLLTTHPASSYTLTQQGNTSLLTITDPSAFWSNSRFLVIKTK